MVNLLGEHLENLYVELPALKDWKIHLYGKEEPKTKRKMGHVTILRENATAALTEVEQSSIWKRAKEKIGG